MDAEIVELVSVAMGILLYLAIIVAYYAMMGLSEAIMVFSYVMQGIGLSAMAKHRGIERSWIAWVPFVNTWVVGKLSDRYREQTAGEDPNLRKKLMIRKGVMTGTLLLFFGIVLAVYASMVVAIISAEVFCLDLEAIMMPIMVAFYVALLVWCVVYTVSCVFYLITQYKALFDVFRSCDPKTSTVFFVLSFFSQIAMTLGIFLNRHKALGLPTESEEISAE